MILDYLFLPILFFIALITSYQDFRYGKIKNKWIILGLVWGLGVYLLLLIWVLIVPYLSQVFSREFTFILPSYILKVFINSAIALLVGYLLWYFDFWSAGDAKLFFVFSLLLPLKYYWKSALPYFPSFSLLINIFIPTLFFLVSQNLVYFLKSFSVQRLKTFWSSGLSQFKKDHSKYLKTFFGFLLIFLIFRIVKSESENLIEGGGILRVGFIFLLTVLRKSLSKIFQEKWFLILLSFGLIFYLMLEYFFYSQPIMALFVSPIKNSLFFMVIFMIISGLASIIEESQKKDLPFAIWVTIGALITIILKGSLIHWLMQFMGGK